MGKGLNRLEVEGCRLEVGRAGSFSFAFPHVLLLPILCITILFAGCGTDDKPDQRDRDTTPAVVLPPAPQFDPDSAYTFIEKQVAFGPRVPGSAAHEACGDWLVAQLKANGATVIERHDSVIAFNNRKMPLRNIIGSWKPEAKERILLFAHWDTRPCADRDDDRKHEPIDGANDGGSG